MKGYVHSFETCGAVDGPGLRFVVFAQGCPLRCKYCHNPDTWAPRDGQIFESDALFKKIRRYKPFMQHSGGGLTFSGGEPLLQAKFVADVFKKTKAEGIHNALDTSGAGSKEDLHAVLPYTDLVLLDVKSTDSKRYYDLTKGKFSNFNQTLQLTFDYNVPVWLRLVVVPGITDGEEEVTNINKITDMWSHIHRVELLPYHKMGDYKWEELNIPYELKNTPSPSSSLMEKRESQLNTLPCLSQKKVCSIS